MNRTILTVDDSAIVRQMVAFILEGAGYTVVEAVDGRDAIGKLDQSPAMVICDLNLPRLDGLGLIRAIRGHPRQKDLPIVVLGTQSEVALAMAAGATAWLVKPFLSDKLLAVVQNAFGSGTDSLVRTE